MKYNYINYIWVAGIIFLLSSCLDIYNRKTTMKVEDNERHYYAVLAGQQKDLSFKLINTGKNPLMITDIITSCGCLKVGDGNGKFSVPPGKERILTLSYNSAKNVGYVKHYIALYGNFEKLPYQEIVFDIHVVPNALYTQDYEELYADEIKREGGLKNLVEGEENNKGYYLDEDMHKNILPKE
ncbi:hypothetical protein D3C72_1430840 [compost metagenome]